MNILEQIVQDKLIKVQESKSKLPLVEIQNLVKNIDYIPKKFHRNKLQLIAEIKQKSPSKGIIRSNFNPVELASLFESKGANCLSVLTEEKYFGGNLEIFAKVRKATSLPLLRKDFIIDLHQVWETRLIQADIILLIVKVLNERLLEFAKTALDLGLQCLIETHSQEELEFALDSLKNLESNQIILGVNNRNLDSFELNLNNCLKLKRLIPSKYISVAESGINTKQDLELIEEVNFDAVLIGEGLAKNLELLEYWNV